MISPSRLAYVDACPRFKPSPFKDDAANEGILLHEYMEKLVGQSRLNWQSYIDSLREPEHFKILLQFAADKLYKLLKIDKCYPDTVLQRGGDLTEPGNYPELKIETSPGRYGYIDLLIVEPNGVYTIIDYKFVRNEGDYELQLAAYACSLRHAVSSPVNEIRSYIIAPRLEDEVEEKLSAVYTNDILDKYDKLIEEVEERADNPNSTCHPGSHCARCKYTGQCSAQIAFLGKSMETCEDTRVSATLLTNAVASFVSLMSLGKEINDEERAARRDFITLATSVADAIKQDDKEYFLLHEDRTLPGYTLRKMEGRASLDKDRLKDINLAITSTLHVTPADLLSMSVPEKDSVIEYLMTHGSYSLQAAKKEYSNVVAPFMKAGAPYIVLTKAGKKQRIKTNKAE